MLPDNLGHLFDVPLRLTPDAVAVIQDDTTLTYRGLDARASRMANLLAALGVGAGDQEDEEKATGPERPGEAPG